MKLYLGSQSAMRQHLLREAGIPFEVVISDCDEESFSKTGEAYERTAILARAKVEGIDITQLPREFMLLGADTLIELSESDEIFGKPKSYQHAVEMLRKMQKNPIEILTSQCLRLYRDNNIFRAETLQATCTKASFVVPDRYISEYLERCPHAMYACGATVIEGYGSRFLENINGSLSSALGLDIYKLVAGINWMKKR